MELGRLVRVEPRDIWANEAHHFTPWLAEEDNLSLLGQAIGIDLQWEATEKSVGPFSADILCKDLGTDTLVLIENQLERTDHKHLGQLITYASGLQAVTIVWIANPFTPEHRSALDWLNQITGGKFNFFGLEVELWRIGTSPPAPKFNVICKPNNWNKTVSEGVARVEAETRTPVKQLQLDFWTHFNQYCQEHQERVRVTKPLAQNWMFLGLGKTGYKLIAIASTWDNEAGSYGGGELRAEVGLFEDPKEKFELLLLNRAEIETELGYQLEWHNDPAKQSCKIFVRKSVDLNNRTDWDNQSAWLLQHLEDLHRVFAPRIRSL